MLADDRLRSPRTRLHVNLQAIAFSSARSQAGKGGVTRIAPCSSTRLAP